MWDTYISNLALNVIFLILDNLFMHRSMLSRWLGGGGREKDGGFVVTSLPVVGTFDHLPSPGGRSSNPLPLPLVILLKIIKMPRRKRDLLPAVMKTNTQRRITFDFNPADPKETEFLISTIIRIDF